MRIPACVNILSWVCLLGICVLIRARHRCHALEQSFLLLFVVCLPSQKPNSMGIMPSMRISYNSYSFSTYLCIYLFLFSVCVCLFICCSAFPGFFPQGGVPRAPFSMHSSLPRAATTGRRMACYDNNSWWFQCFAQPQSICVNTCLLLSVCVSVCGQWWLFLFLFPLCHTTFRPC